LGAALGAALGVQVQSPIVPVVLGTERAALEVGAALLRRGFHVPAIRPPTVPAGSSRLRLSLSADHSLGDVLEVAEAVKECRVAYEAAAAAAAKGVVAGWQQRRGAAAPRL
jgi:8-amino-7-oxononanoate synthase